MNRQVRQRQTKTSFAGRRWFLFAVMLAGMALLVGRSLYLQIINRDFYQSEGKHRHVQKVAVSAYRGKILDRNGEPLAISTPVHTVWADPGLLADASAEQLAQLQNILELSKKTMARATDRNSKSHYVRLKHQVIPDVTERLRALKIAGLNFDRSFKRFYPSGEVAAHLLGFTNIDDQGQTGIELAYDRVLRGVEGSKWMIKDGKRNLIAHYQNIKDPVPGKDLVLSIDKRLQYLAYRELKAAVLANNANSGSLVMLDAKTGDVLAVANQPGFNPNLRASMKSSRYRNRAITDVFEPGSTVKPFVVAGALDSKAITLDYSVDTSPGTHYIGRYPVRDVRDYGVLNLTRTLKKSSNIAVSKIAMDMPAETFWGFYNRLGFGVSAGVGFPGEANGYLLDYQGLKRFEQATLSFGYGVSMSVLQLARAYTALADDGLLHSVSLLKRQRDEDAQRVFAPATARRIRTMLEEVVKKDGTAYQARVEGYRVAGKTGTVKKAIKGGYAKKKYLSVFVGMAPAGDPKLVMAIMIDEPKGKHYYGGLIAGPVFSKVMSGALRVLSISPDQEMAPQILMVNKGDQA